MNLVLNGRKCDFDQLRAHVCHEVHDWALRWLAKGEMPPYFADARYVQLVFLDFFGLIDDYFKKESLSPEESAWFEKLLLLRHKLATIDWDAHEALQGEARQKFAISLGIEIAKILEGMQAGYEHPPQCVPDPLLIHPQSFFVSKTREVIVTDPKTGISYPMGLLRCD